LRLGKQRKKPCKINGQNRGANSWAEFSNVFRRTREAYLEHEKARAELKGLMPDDAREAFGHGIRAKRSKSGAVSFMTACDF